MPVRDSVSLRRGLFQAGSVFTAYGAAHLIVIDRSHPFGFAALAVGILCLAASLLIRRPNTGRG